MQIARTVGLYGTPSVLDGWHAGNRQRATGNGQPATGNRQPAAGNTQLQTGAGDRQLMNGRRGTANGKGQQLMEAQQITDTTSMLGSAGERRREAYGRRKWVSAGVVLLAVSTGLAETHPRAADLAGNPVAHWNSIAEGVFTPTEGTDPLGQSRTMAILHASIHDALNAIDLRFAPYTPGLTATPGASVDAAIAAAAREVLVTLVPDQAAIVEAAYARALAPLPENAATAQGITLGRAAAAATLHRRAQDGFDGITQPTYQPRPVPGDYQFTAPFDFAGAPGLGRVQPFAIDLRDHLVDGPLPLTSSEYARDLAYVKSIGDRNSRTRTAEQSEIAQFWYEDSPLGWNRITNIVVRQQQLDAWTAARAFALVNFAMADGFIAGFDAKYHFRFWRPVTAIHAAAADSNARTEPDPAWQPFLLTPPVPDYPSTHTVLGAAAAEVLIDLFGDKVRYRTSSLTLPGVTRQYKGFSTAAKENGLSRIYAGIHFRHAVDDGYRQGRSIGRAVAASLPPLQ
jgi:hypothetical protein